jgi:hypothetical protein
MIFDPSYLIVFLLFFLLFSLFRFCVFQIFFLLLFGFLPLPFLSSFHPYFIYILDSCVFHVYFISTCLGLK